MFQKMAQSRRTTHMRDFGTARLGSTWLGYSGKGRVKLQISSQKRKKAEGKKTRALTTTIDRGAISQGRWLASYCQHQLH